MPDTLVDLSRDLARMAEQVSPHVVAVEAGGAASSGFVWREGLVVVADEALEAEEGLAVVRPDGSRVPAALVGRDPSTDVALLRVEGAGAPVAFDPAPRRVGEIALALGRGPRGPLAALGVVSEAGPAWRSLRGGMIEARIGLDLRLQRAAEGGLVADAEGRAFGMAVFGPRRAAIVIPAATVERVASHLLAHGRVARGWLGLALQPVALDGGEDRGLLVVGLEAEAPARAAGVAQGDILVALGGEPVGGMRALFDLLGPETVGREMPLALRRGGQALTLPVTVGERPER
jgi:S1-C subfamily serine protease